MLFVAGARIRDFLLFFSATLVAMVVLALTSPYRMKRLTGFLDPWADPFDSGFQLTQSLIAIGSGEWFGVGLGYGVQKLFYLPEAHTDFVFAVFAEEFGLLGSLVLIALFLALLWRIFSIAKRAAATERFFEAYLAMGLGTWLGLQAFINIGVNMGLLPTKGLTLPLISYGRSSLIVTMAAIGLLLRIHHELVVDARPVTDNAEGAGNERAAHTCHGGRYRWTCLSGTRCRASTRGAFANVVWLGTHRGLESTVVPDAGIDIEWVSVRGLRRKGLLAMLIAPLQLAWALLQSLSVILRRRPAAVLGMGGFVSGPGGLAAWLTRRPLVIHEQNAAAGLTNRLLARLARVVLQAFPGSFNSSVSAETVGNPVREDIAAVAIPADRFDDRQGPLRLLVLGGSQGALALNKTVPAALSKLTCG